MWSAVLVRALRDYCSPDARTSGSVSRWLGTESFSTICRWAGVEVARMRTVFEALSLLEPKMRGLLLRQISIQKVEPETIKPDPPLEGSG
jgi:hypothetical protein